jgi:hypothetical protein
LESKDLLLLLQLLVILIQFFTTIINTVLQLLVGFPSDSLYSIKFDPNFVLLLSVTFIELTSSSLSTAAAAAGSVVV